MEMSPLSSQSSLDPCFFYAGSQQWVVSRFLHKEGEILTGRDRMIMWTKDGFLSQSHWSVLEGEGSGWRKVSSGRHPQCVTCIAVSWCGRITFKSQQEETGSRYLQHWSFLLANSQRMTRLLVIWKEKKDSLCFRTDLIWMSFKYFIVCCWLGALSDDKYRSKSILWQWTQSPL